jgi:hypothetical protein
MVFRLLVIFKSGLSEIGAAISERVVVFFCILARAAKHLSSRKASEVCDALKLTTVYTVKLWSYYLQP